MSGGTSSSTLADRLRALHAARRPHFQPHHPDGTPRPTALAVVATEERWADLLTAAAELEAAQRLTQVQAGDWGPR